ncbi:MAG TPA: DUF3891 family protein [Candidatus Dormibacteraeota bacterium]|nr:DUF3891 family protein [Candidatus Dormibacteraeota bacterium]
MIIQDQGQQLALVRQTDHAILAGFFAREWGNERFTKPEPFESFRLAVAEHDNGWSDWELHPQIDYATFAPYSFMSIPTADHIELYKRGIDRMVKADQYAGLLTTMHVAGLYDRARATMPGYSAKYVKTNETQVVGDFVQRLRLQQLRLKVDLRADARRKDFAEDKALQMNLQRMDALDRLSLYFCMGPLADAVIEGVPQNDLGQEVDWELRPLSGQAVTLMPYPFRRDPLEISILARRIPKRRYSDDEDLQKTLAVAPFFATHFTLSAGSTDARSLAARA